MIFDGKGWKDKTYEERYKARMYFLNRDVSNSIDKITIRYLMKGRLITAKHQMIKDGYKLKKRRNRAIEKVRLK